MVDGNKSRLEEITPNYIRDMEQRDVDKIHQQLHQIEHREQSS